MLYDSREDRGVWIDYRLALEELINHLCIFVVSAESAMQLYSESRTIVYAPPPPLRKEKTIGPRSWALFPADARHSQHL